MVPVRVTLLRNIKKSLTEIPNLPGVYKWWCDKNTLLDFINQISAFSQITDIEVNTGDDILINQVEHCRFDAYEKELYCFYVGKADSSQGLRDRLISNHIKGNVNGSTLRKSIYSLKYGYYDSHNLQHKYNDKNYVDGILDLLYVGWQDYLQADVLSNEIREINSYLRIFNIDTGDLNDSVYLFDVNYRHNVLNNLSESRKKRK